jgi:biopolymer transport protein ExbD
MGRRYKLNIDRNAGFELDLAPLLAVMVKLVPVLLISSAFVQMMIVETDLPQVVQQAIQKQNSDPNSTQISIELSKIEGVKIIITENGQQKVDVVGVNKEKQLDYKLLHSKFVELKKLYPQIFKIDFNPASDVAYKDMMRVMDEARKSRDITVRFPVKDSKTGQDTTTDYMFPEVVFANMMDG